MATRILLIILFVVIAIGMALSQTSPARNGVPVYNVNGVELSNAHIVVGQVVVPLTSLRIPLDPGTAKQINQGISVVLTDAAAFTNAESYKCFGSQLVGVAPDGGGTFRYIDGKHFTIHVAGGKIAWRFDFVCIGS